MKFDAKHSVTQGLDHLTTRLAPIIGSKLAPHIPGLPWTMILEQLDQLAGRRPLQYSQTDLQPQLRLLTTRLGELGFPFDDSRRTASTLGNELRIVRNSWAHGDKFTSLDAWRAHDYCVRLMEFFGDAAGLVKANELRHQAVQAYVREEGIAPVPVGPVHVDEEHETDDDEVVTPDLGVFKRETKGQRSVIGDNRLAFEPWEPVSAGDISVLDDLPTVDAKMKVRAVAAVIVEAEGPIHADRLVQLIAAAFGVGRLHASRASKLSRQVKAAGLTIDKDKFVWPEGFDPDLWTEFRPNSSQLYRPFLYISPVDIANAMRFLLKQNSDLSITELESATLRTFGRKRRTRQFTTHLAKAKVLSQSSSPAAVKADTRDTDPGLVGYVATE